MILCLENIQDDSFYKLCSLNTEKPTLISFHVNNSIIWMTCCIRNQKKLKGELLKVDPIPVFPLLRYKSADQFVVKILVLTFPVS